MFLTISVGLKDGGKTLQACMKKHRSQMNAAIGTEKRICGVAWIGHLFKEFLQKLQYYINYWISRVLEI